MIYIVLREPTTSGGYVNRFAFSDQRTSLAIDCGGASISAEAYITTISEMANKLDISQAKGGLGQGVEWSASLADWDGTERISEGIFDGSARFYGWSAAIARSDAETATPDWINDVDHWMVTDVSTDGGTISITVGERWANDGRLLAFGQDGATVPLVVGGHDVWVPTVALPSAVVVEYDSVSTLYYGNPNAGTQAAVRKSESTYRGNDPITGRVLYGWDCIDPAAAAAFKAAVDGGYITKNGYAVPVDHVGIVTGSPNRVVLSVPDWFWDLAIGSDPCVVYQYPSSAPIAAGASQIINFSSGDNLSSPAGTVAVVDGVLTFAPKYLHPDKFTSFDSVPCKIAWDTTSHTAPSAYPGLVEYYEDVDGIITDPNAPLNAFTVFSSVPSDGLSIVGGAQNFIVRQSGIGSHGAQPLTLRLRIVPAGEVTASRIAVAYDARILQIATSLSGASATQFLYKMFDKLPVNLPVTSFAYSDTHLPPVALGEITKFGIFSSIDDANSAQGVELVGSLPLFGSEKYSWAIEVRGIYVYAVNDFAFGSAHALVRTSAFPFPYAGYATNDRLDRAATTLIEQLAPYHGVTISPAAPTFLPTAAQGGECLDASKTYRDNAVALLEETWQVLGVTAYGATPTNGQGLGEIPTPVSIVLGRFEDIVTEPVIEFCPVAGTLTKKAYVAYVDQPFDATNPGKFYGGWGPSVQPDSLVIDGITWTITHFPPPQAGSGNWYQATLSDGLLHFQWVPFVNYGYLIWKQCRAAYLVHKVKRGATYQFNGIYDESVVGQMWWESRRNGSRRIEWLCLQPRYLTYSVREAKPLAWSGSAVYIAGTLANYAGYDVSTWDNAGGDTLVVVDRTYDLLTGIGKYTVAIPPVPTVDAVAIYRDTLDAAHTIDKLVDTIDATAVTTKYTDTLEA